MTRTWLFSLITFAAMPVAAQVSGSMQTTLPTGVAANGNIYPSKEQVFLSAGPQNQKSSGLADGRYYFQITDPSGSTLLSNDPAACRQIVVSGGRLAGAFDPVTQSLEPAGTPLDTANCEHGSVALAAGAVAVQVGGAFHACAIGANSSDIFCDTPNPGGEYKLWLIAQPSASSKCNTTVNRDGFTLNFDRSCAKTDNFKSALPAVSHVVACKFNDANSNGVLDPGELMISGWPITATVPASSYVTLRSDTQSGSSITATTDSTGCVSFSASGIPANTQTPVTLTEASELRWMQTAPGNGTYDATGKPAVTGPTSVSAAVPLTGAPAAGGIITVNLGAGVTVTAPKFANTNPACPDCSILGTVTAVNTATPNKLYTWGISKTVDKTEIDVGPGGNGIFTYTVSVTHDGGAGSLLTGTITLINADGSHPSVTLNVIDAVNDGGVCKIQDPVSGQYVAEVFNLTVNSYTEKLLPYQCAYTAPTPAAGKNTVTATNVSNPSVQYTSAATYNFGASTAIADQTVAVTDTNWGGALGTVHSTDASPHTFQYSLSFSGGSDAGCVSHNNTATLTTSTTGTTASASQSVKVCVKNPITITTTPNPTAVTTNDGSPLPILKDSATISGGTNPTGAITFTLVFNGQTVDTETVAVHGNGTYTTPAGYAARPKGTYQWNASYSGDANNAAVSESGNAAEQVSVAHLSLGATGTDSDGDLPFDGFTGATAVLTGGSNPTGNLVFTFFNPVGSPSCTFTLPVNGSGVYSTPISCKVSDSSGAEWNVTYSGDTKNASQTAITQIYDIAL